MNREVRLGEYAHEMRRNPTEPEKRLWRNLSNSQLGYKFRRQSVVGPYIADFLCPAKALIVEVDGDTHDVDKDRYRDRTLRELGCHVMHFTNHDVMTNMEGVLMALQLKLCALVDRWPHPNPVQRLFALSGGQGCRCTPEGEGL
jgi:very-short-patch-repair endonuclease